MKHSFNLWICESRTLDIFKRSSELVGSEYSISIKVVLIEVSSERTRH